MPLKFGEKIQIEHPSEVTKVLKEGYIVDVYIKHGSVKDKSGWIWSQETYLSLYNPTFFKLSGKQQMKDILSELVSGYTSGDPQFINKLWRNYSKNQRNFLKFLYKDNGVYNAPDIITGMVDSMFDGGISLTREMELVERRPMEVVKIGLEPIGISHVPSTPISIDTIDSVIIYAERSIQK